MALASSTHATGRGTAGTAVGTDRVDRRLALLLTVVALLYTLTASWSPPWNVDTYTNVVQARAFATGSATVEGSEHLVDARYYGRTILLVATPEGAATSQYPPGVALWGAPFYLLDPSVTEVDSTFTTADGASAPVRHLVPSFVPGTMAAVVATTLATLFLGLTLRPHLSETAVVTTVGIVALGTGAWSVASDQLWQHSPGMMTISLGVLLASRGRFAGSGLAFAGAALVRPHTAIIAAAIGITVAVRRRSLRPALAMGATSVLGVAGVVAYNRVVFGEATLWGGYGPVFVDRTLAAGGESYFTWLSRIGEALVHPSHGILVSSPVVIVAIVALWGRTWRAPDWALGGALGALAYLLVQYKANRVSGGNVIFGYRYPLDPMMAAAPLAALATTAWVRANRRRLVALGVLAAVSIAAHGWGAFTAGV